MPLLLTAVAVALAGAFGLGRLARRWRARQESRLRAGSTVVETSRGPVEYAERGSGPAVVVFHGTPGGFDQALVALPDLDIRVIAPSRPGYLRTPLASGAAPSEQAGLVAALLDRIGVAEAAVVGISGGGAAAVAFALDHPGRTTRLLLLGAVTRPTSVDIDNLLSGPATSDVAAWAIATLVARAPALVLPANWRSDPPTLRRAQALAVSAFPLDPRTSGLVNDRDTLATMPRFPLARVAAPTLIVHATDDASVPIADAERAASEIPGARLVVVPGRHESAALDPAAVAAIRAFLA